MKQIITTALIAIITGVMMLYAVALITLPAHADNTTDYCDKDMSEQISADWERKAKAEWIAEFGDAQPNLNREAQLYLEHGTARLQGLYNGK
ncbi:hypothetical protein [Aggregatibacter actinomycetemcomitans]|uniref:hypothetical protein n=1 Tax=Aggregatibacter actinomycetemcomitans TaxID=714 RepID=UPI002151D3F2|nr:hypothetical protein [Aggregatibacter actinomycetemcomitans]